MRDILARLRGSSPNEGSHELYCRCLDAAREIERLRGGNEPANPPCECGNEGCDGQRYRPPYSRLSQPCPRQCADMTVYTGDDYPREGCVAAVDVNQYGFGLRIQAPNGAVIESYAAAKTPAQIGRMLTEWCQGLAPRLHATTD